MLEFGDAVEPFRLVGEAWVKAKQRPLQERHVRSFRFRATTQPKQKFKKNKQTKKTLGVLHPHLRDVDYNITVGHVGYPNKSLLDDPLTLDLDVRHGRPWSQQEWRGA